MSESVETATLAIPLGQTGTVVRSTVLRRLVRNPLGALPTNA